MNAKSVTTLNLCMTSVRAREKRPTMQIHVPLERCSQENLDALRGLNGARARAQTRRVINIYAKNWSHELPQRWKVQLQPEDPHRARSGARRRQNAPDVSDHVQMQLSPRR